MTAPQPYPGEGGGTVTPPHTGPGRASLTYRDVLDRPLVGTVHITNPQGSSSIVQVDGELDIELAPGTYRVIADLRDVDGRPAYRIDTVIV